MAATIDIDIALPKGDRLPAALAVPAATASPAPRGGRDREGRGVIVVHEMLGLNDDIRRIAARFADEGYVAIAPDFLAGLGPRPLCMARFFRGIGRVGRGRPYRQLGEATRWLAARPDVDPDRIAIAGFCVGGGFALLHVSSAGGADRARIAAVAPFYAAVPDDPAALGRLCPVVAAYGARDGVFASHAARLEAGLAAAGVEHEVTVHPEAGHSFMNRHGRLLTALERRLPVRGGYHEPSAEAAWSQMLAFLDRHLGRAARVRA